LLLFTASAFAQSKAESQAKFSQYKPAEFIDARLLTEIDKSGYIDKLYSGQAR